jgi:hypothetical protein
MPARPVSFTVNVASLIGSNPKLDALIASRSSWRVWSLPTDSLGLPTTSAAAPHTQAATV